MHCPASMKKTLAETPFLWVVICCGQHVDPPASDGGAFQIRRFELFRDTLRFERLLGPSTLTPLRKII